MAGKYGRILTSIWRDKDFKKLRSDAQIVYIALVSSDSTTFAGVCPLVPAHYADISADMTERKFAAAVTVLEREGFVVTDKRTVELAVRTFVKHDDSLKSPNMAKAVAKALDSVHSQGIRAAIVGELAKMLTHNPELKGWQGFAEQSPELFREITDQVLGNPSG